MKNRLLLTSAAAAALLLLAGCSGSPNAEDSASSSGSASGQSDAQSSAPAEIRVAGPASPPSLPILRMMETDALGDTDIAFEQWQTQDQLTAAVTQGGEFTAAPLTTGAALAAQGSGIELLNVSAWAVMGLVTTDPSIQSVDDLSGKTIHIAMRASAVDYTMQLVLRAHDLTDDVEIVYTDATNGPEQFLAGQIQTLITVEPQVTLLTTKNPEARSVVDFAAEWATITDSDLPLPTAGNFVNTEFADEHPDTVEAFHEAYAEAAEWVEAHPDEAGALAEEQFGLPSAVVAAAIPKISWEVERADEARPAVAEYFAQIFESWPEAVGGELPGDAFYGE